MDNNLRIKCIELLVELDRIVGDNITAKSMILELGYHIKQDAVSNREKGRMPTKDEVNKLHQENQQLICDNLRLQDMLSSKIPAIENALERIVSGYETISSAICNIREIQKTL